MTGLSLLDVLILIVAYWLVAILVFVIRGRRRDVAELESISETEAVVTFTDSISDRRVAAVALLPSALILLAWLVTRP